MSSFFRTFFTSPLSSKIRGFTPSNPAKSGSAKPNSTGFTLVEMLVVISIVIILSTVVLLNFPKYSANQQLQLAAQDVLTTIRETQIYGIAVKGHSSGTKIIYNGQGIYIGKSYFGTQLPYKHIISYIDKNYSDNPSDSTLRGFDQALDDECIGTDSYFGPCFKKLISEPVVITDVCTSDGKCLSTGGIDGVDILFERPEPEPIIWTIKWLPTGVKVRTQVTSAEITLQAQSSPGVSINGINPKVISIIGTGQVSIRGENATPSTTPPVQTFCPFIYSWNGNEFVFEHKAQSLPIALEHTTYSPLFYADDSQGEIKVRIAELRDNTFINKYKVFAVDSPILNVETYKIFPDTSGVVHSIKDPAKPKTCEIGVNKEDCLQAVSHDDDYYVSIGAEEGGNERLSLESSFVVPKENDVGKIYVQFHTNSVFDEILVKIQDALLPWVVSLWNASANKPNLRNINGLASLDEALSFKVFIDHNGEWKEVGRKYPSFRKYPEYIVIPIESKDITSETIKIKIESQGWYLIDQVGIDWEKDIPLTVKELERVNTQNAHEDLTTSISSKIDTQDDKYFTLQNGEYVDFTYAVPPSTKGTKRTYISEFGGYYTLNSPRNTYSSEHIKDTVKIFYNLFKSKDIQDGLREALFTN